MTDKIREFYELVHGMNHGDLRMIARTMTQHMSARGNAFNATDYRDMCDVLFDCASEELGIVEAEVEAVPAAKVEAAGNTPAAAFRRKGAISGSERDKKGGYTGIDSVLNRESSGSR